MNRNEYSPLIFVSVIVVFRNVIITSRETNPDEDGEQSDFNIFLSVYFLCLCFFWLRLGYRQTPFPAILYSFAFTTNSFPAILTSLMCHKNACPVHCVCKESYDNYAVNVALLSLHITLLTQLKCG